MKPTSIVLHHTAGPAGTVASIRTMHKARGFSDIGYHYLIGNGRGMEDGEIQPGRPESKNGGGVYGNNSNRLQAAMVGNFHKPDPGYTGPPSPHQLRTLGEWLLKHGREHAIPAGKVYGHREIALKNHATACPGSEFPLEKIREWYGANLGKPHPQPLDEFLGRGEEPPLTVTLDGMPVKVRALLVDGTSWIATRDLAAALSWPVPVYEHPRNVLHVRTKGG